MSTATIKNNETYYVKQLTGNYGQTFALNHDQVVILQESTSMGSNKDSIIIRTNGKLKHPGQFESNLKLLVDAEIIQYDNYRYILQNWQYIDYPNLKTIRLNNKVIETGQESENVVLFPENVQDSEPETVDTVEDSEPEPIEVIGMRFDNPAHMLAVFSAVKKISKSTTFRNKYARLILCKPYKQIKYYSVADAEYFFDLADLLHIIDIDSKKSLSATITVNKYPAFSKLNIHAEDGTTETITLDCRRPKKSNQAGVVFLSASQELLVNCKYSNVFMAANQLFNLSMLDMRRAIKRNKRHMELFNRGYSNQEIKDALEKEFSIDNDVFVSVFPASEHMKADTSEPEVPRCACRT